eukprot:902773-Prymnesium_polylepis.1
MAVCRDTACFNDCLNLSESAEWQGGLLGPQDHCFQKCCSIRVASRTSADAAASSGLQPSQQWLGMDAVITTIEEDLHSLLLPPPSPPLASLQATTQDAFVSKQLLLALLAAVSVTVVLVFTFMLGRRSKRLELPDGPTLLPPGQPRSDQPGLAEEGQHFYVAKPAAVPQVVHHGALEQQRKLDGYVTGSQNDVPRAAVVGVLAGVPGIGGAVEGVCVSSGRPQER